MKQFTVYASDGEGGSGCAVYMVNFTRSGVVTYPLRKGWHAVAEGLEREINKRHFGSSPSDPFSVPNRNL